LQEDSVDVVVCLLVLWALVSPSLLLFGWWHVVTSTVPQHYIA
jgi:hypothetical protein